MGAMTEAWTEGKPAALAGTGRQGCEEPEISARTQAGHCMTLELSQGS